MLIFADETPGNYQTTKLEIQKDATGLNDELGTEVQILLNITSNSKFFLLLKTVPGEILNEYSLKICFGKTNKQTKTEPI